jgi:C4-type Zn-finger protein
MSSKSNITLRSKCPLCGHDLYAYYKDGKLKTDASGYKVACTSLRCSYEDIDIFKDDTAIAKKGYKVA